MKLKVYVIDLETPRWLRKFVAYAVPALVVSAVGIAMAAVPVDFSAKAGQPLKAADLASNFTYLQNEITALQTQVVPPGVVEAYGGAVVPAGWLLCDGTAVSRMTYAALFAAIGTSHGSGAGGTTFNLPDYRGRFLRGVDNPTGGAPAGRDPDAAGRAAAATGGNAGNAVGSMQAQATSKNGLVLSDPGHSHNLIINGNVQAFAYGDGAVSTSNYFRYANGGNGNFGTLSIQPGSSNTSLGNGDSETRPINAYVNYVIKY